MWRKTLAVAACTLMLAAPANGQATFLPAFNAPVRAFERSEFGVLVHFADGIDFALEGEFRLAAGGFDVGFRGGFIEPEPEAADAFVVFGVEFRQQVISHGLDFPLDGAFIIGAGALLPDGGEALNIPIGLSLGRRIDLENSEVSIVPFAQPTLFLLAGDLDDHVQFALGLGVDFRLTRRFDARLGASLGDLEGISLGAVWVR